MGKIKLIKLSFLKLIILSIVLSIFSNCENTSYRGNTYSARGSGSFRWGAKWVVASERDIKVTSGVYANVAFVMKVVQKMPEEFDEAIVDIQFNKKVEKEKFCAEVTLSDTNGHVYRIGPEKWETSKRVIFGVVDIQEVTKVLKKLHKERPHYSEKEKIKEWGRKRENYQLSLSIELYYLSYDNEQIVKFENIRIPHARLIR